MLGLDFEAIRKLVARDDFSMVYDCMHGVQGPYARACLVGEHLPTPAINEGCARSLRISHTSRRALLQPVSKTQVPCTPYHPPTRTGVWYIPLQICLFTSELQWQPSCERRISQGGVCVHGKRPHHRVGRSRR
jgi:hypothetical protein